MVMKRIERLTAIVTALRAELVNANAIENAKAGTIASAMPSGPPTLSIKELRERE
jgi:hypothetical protein